jgi:hypothetical protein
VSKNRHFTRGKSYISAIRSGATKEASRTIVVTAVAIGLLLAGMYRRSRCAYGGEAAASRRQEGQEAHRRASTLQVARPGRWEGTILRLPPCRSARCEPYRPPHPGRRSLTPASGAGLPAGRLRSQTLSMAPMSG